jgi:ATP-dependent exoDNAse (exonuclease V) beta subunit
MSPALVLGSAVHEVIENLSVIPTSARFSESLVLRLEKIWDKFEGKRGGFLSSDQEHFFKERGKAMLRKVMDNPGPLKNRAVKINQELPYYWISEEDNIILCGKIDWLEYFPETDSVHIIDFKTSKKEEDEKSLQLPIYILLVNNCKKRKVDKASYWYLELSNDLVEKSLPDLDNAQANILKIARQIKLAKKLDKLSCPNGQEGCPHCLPYESILKGEGELVGNNSRQDVYIIPEQSELEEDSIIL